MIFQHMDQAHDEQIGEVSASLSVSFPSAQSLRTPIAQSV